MKDKLRAEASGILAWLVRGCFEWQDGGLKPPESVQLATQSYRQGEDSVLIFLIECCDTSDDKARIGAGELFKAYSEFTGKSALRQNVFATRISERFTKTSAGGRRFYNGICLGNSTSSHEEGHGGEVGEAGEPNFQENTRRRPT